MDVLTMQQRGSNIAALFHAQSLGNFATAVHRTVILSPNVWHMLIKL
jgi:hypothetical protein